MPGAPFLLFDDARAGGARPRLYRDPVEIIVATTIDEVRPALARVKAGLAAGRHAAGYLAYEAGQALDPALVDGARVGDGPLVWFGLFDRVETPDLDALLSDPAGAITSAPRPRILPAHYALSARRVREQLFAGDYYQANLTFGCDVTALGSPLALYARLRGRQRGGWGGVVDLAGRWLVSLSPEQFFTLRGGTLEARPMKGTAPRHADPHADAAEAAALAADPKQRAENLMIVDLMRNDLARIAETGSVEVPELFRVETYPTLHQLTSRVTARLRAGLDAIDVIETIFPCGSVTGAPKVAAMLALRTLEPEPRGAYTGSMGWIEPGGDAAFNVLIRTLEGEKAKPVARLGLGSGLVVDSEARKEWAECLLKGEFVASARETFDLIETMRFDPRHGIVELERHLERMRSSARALGFAFDRHSARNELQAATFGHKDVGMVRLLLSRTGAFAIQVKPLDDNPAEPVAVARVESTVEADDWRLRHKTTDRRFYDRPREDSGRFDVAFTRGQVVTEGSRTTIFVERDGKLVTPPLEAGLFPGVLRQKLIEEGRAVEGALSLADLQNGFLIGNSLRGLMRAVLA